MSFHHHDVVGAKLARKRLTALRFSNEVVKAVVELIELHLRFHGYGDGEWTDSAVRRYVRDAGDQLERLHILTRADCTTRNQARGRRAAVARTTTWSARIGVLAEQEELEALRPGPGRQPDHGRSWASRPGRDVGQAYRSLLERRIEDGPLGPDRAREELLAWWADGKSS